MQGVWIPQDTGESPKTHPSRPKSKAALKRVIAAHGLAAVQVEATSLHGNEWGGPLDQAPVGTYYIVGPDPYELRNWYATIAVSASGVTVK